jgi:hypothetical protein
MPKYRITLDDGRVATIEAANPQEAQAFVNSAPELQSRPTRQAPNTAQVAPSVRRVPQGQLNPSQQRTFELLTRRNRASAYNPRDNEAGSRLNPYVINSNIGRGQVSDIPAGKFYMDERGVIRQSQAVRQNVEALGSGLRRGAFGTLEDKRVALDSTIGQAMRNPMDVLSNDGRRSLGEYFNNAEQQAKARAEELQYNNPLAYNSGYIGTLIGSSALGEGVVARGIGAVAPKLAASRPILNNALSAGITGAAQGAMQAEDGNRLEGAALGGVLGAGIVGGLGAGGKVINNIRNARVDPSVARLSSAGIDNLTHGQINGGLVNQIEQFTANLPLGGYMVDKARLAPYESLNKVAVNRALNEIGQSLPDTVNAGHDSIAAAQDMFAQAFKQAPDGNIAVTPEMQAISQNIIDANSPYLPADQANVLNNSLKNYVSSLLDNNPELTPQQFQEIISNLSNETALYKGNSMSVAEGRVKQGLQQASQGIQDAVASQYPDYAANLANARKGYAKLAPIEEAASGAGVVNGIASPRQLLQASRKADTSVRRRATAAGKAYDQEFYEDGVKVLGNNLPNSGTAKQVFGTLGLSTAAGAIGQAPIALGTSAAAGIPWTKPFIAASNKSLAKRIAREKLQKPTNPNPKFQKVKNALSYGSKVGAPAYGGNKARERY